MTIKGILIPNAQFLIIFYLLLEQQLLRLA